MNENFPHKIYEKYSVLLTGEKPCEIKNICLNDFQYLTHNFEDFLSSSSDANCDRSNIVVRVTELMVSFGLVKTFNECEDRDYDSTDFPLEARNAEECFKYLNHFLEQYDSIDTAGKRKFLVQVLLLCATHNSEYVWSSQESVAASKEFLEKLLQCSKHCSLSALLCDDTFHPTIFKAILKWMRPTLMPDTWMRNPSYCHIFHWLLSYVKHPYLVDYISDVNPPAFMFTGYFAVPQQILGIQCFDHILDNVPPSLISSDGTQDAIYDAFKQHIYSKEIRIIEVLYPCLLKLPMMNLQKVNHLQWLQFDDVLQQLLFNVDNQSDRNIRHAFLIQILSFIKSTPCFKHLKKILHVLLLNFRVYSPVENDCRILIMKIIKELIRSCWPRMEHHCYDIILAILKTFYDSNVDTSAYEFFSLCEECLHLLKHACPKTFTNLVNEYLQGDDSLPGFGLLQCVSQKPGDTVILNS